MVSYKAPLNDIRFVLYELLDYETTIAALPGYEEATRDVVDAVESHVPHPRSETTCVLK